MTLENGTDAELVDGALAGDAEAFSELFNRYYPMIHAFAYRLCFDKSEAEDVVQETFVKAARSLESCRTAFRPWLYRIALNACHDCNRSHARKTRLAEALAGTTEETEPPAPAEASRLEEAVQALPPEQRESVTLVYMEGLTHAEAATVLQCAETTISWRLFKARRRLKQQLKGETR